MPIYEYRPRSANHCQSCENGFEALQKLNDDPIDSCASCGAPVGRIISAPSLSKSDDSMSPVNLEKHGFTQYKKSAKGEYRKTAGKGPDTIVGD